ncbi:hypothetical protein Kfla_5839 [Kribbella flavida DSM 17836]|uniref:Uncharacterized protein n=1 Tax=Kribbella flavida (strain DSM 17836 / JCM 10339 / NBRC 14399) TaxID=479435 RepID=D2PQE1_KRIFD|nr:hypothetical protein [Kribbella flavida]ADB34843.1 hypothetical protein Kfla_5839 [Kribbella flavida DSM 17836]
MGPDPVFAPDVPVEVRRLYERSPELFVPAGQPRPKRRTAWSEAPGNTLGSLLVWLAVCVGGWIVALIVMALTLPPEVAAWASVALAGVAVVATGAVAVRPAIEDRSRKAVRRQHGKYLLAEDFDEPAGRLLARAQRAVKTVLEATVTRQGLLDEMQNELVLPEQLWDIGQVLHEQSVLRARQHEVARGMATAELEAVLGPQRRALDRSVDAIKRKVQLLEQYAERVRSADAALRAEAALEDGDRYIELLARTEPAGDTSVVQSFADEATALKDTLTRTIDAARAAGRTLALPD